MENIEAMLCAFIEGDLDEAGRAEIEKHLQDHPDHRKLLAELMATRDLVRDLPRVRAPMDVGESLRGQMERSILLDGSESTAGIRPPGARRWTSKMAIAAVLLLSISLSFIVYRTLVPTAKPPAYTEIAVSQTPQGILDRDAAAEHQKLIEEDLATAQSQMQNQAAKTEGSSAKDSLGSSSQGSQSAQGGAANQPPQVALGTPQSPGQSVEKKALSLDAVAQSQQFDVASVRKTIRDFGYDMSASQAGQSQGIVVVVSAADSSQANSTITRFLNTTGNNIAWSKVPNEPGQQSVPATAPSIAGEINRKRDVAQPTTAPSDATFGPDAAHTLAADVGRRQEFAGPVSSGQMSSSQMYVAKGITRQQAEQLKQSLAAVDQLADVYQPQVQSAPSTEPTDSAASPSSDANVLLMNSNVNARAAAPSPAAPPQSIGGATPSTAPSPVASATDDKELQNEGNRTISVDAVIVVQAMEMKQSAEVSKSQALTAAGATTQPASRPDSPTTLPSNR